MDSTFLNAGTSIYHYIHSSPTDRTPHLFGSHLPRAKRHVVITSGSSAMDATRRQGYQHFGQSMAGVMDSVDLL